MPLNAVLLGSIGVLCETSELQRAAFNAAFAEAGLDWNWGCEAYAGMLHRPGGARRIADYAERRGADVDVAALHRRKSEIFQEMLRDTTPPLRPGVGEAIDQAQASGMAVGLVTTTVEGNVATLLRALSPALRSEDFDFIGHTGLVENAKPAPDIYHLALRMLDVAPQDALAFEDSPEGAAAAVAAGIPTVGFPGAMHRRRVFEAALAVQDRLSLDLLATAA